MPNPAAEAARKLRDALTKRPDPPVSTSPLEDPGAPYTKPEKPTRIPIVDERGREVGYIEGDPFSPTEHEHSARGESAAQQRAEGARALAAALYPKDGG